MPKVQGTLEIMHMIRKGQLRFTEQLRPAQLSLFLKK